MLISLLLPALLASPLATGQAEPLAATFERWASDEKNKTYEAMALEFLRASGQSTEGYLQQVEELVRELQIASRDRKTGRQRMEALREVLYTRRGWKSDSDLVDLANLLPNRIVERRRGYCLGLSLLILHLGERLEWPLVAVWTPRHTFVRYRDGSPSINFETTMSGAIHDDEWYRRRFDLSGKARLVEMTPRQLAAHIVNNHGYVLLENGSPKPARRQFEAALRLFPDLVEARINLGVAAARQGEYDSAIRQFDRAAESWPGDPYLTLNRVITLVPLGRAAEALKLGASLLESHPGFEPAFDRLSQARRQVDRSKHWSELQSLSNRLNRARLAKAQRRPGLRGQYFGGRNFEKKILERIDTDLAFSWRWNAPATGVPRDNFSIRWTGYFELEKADRYAFRAVCSDGIRIRVDGALIVDEWKVTTDNFAEAEIELEPGLHDIEIEYFESRGDAGLLVLVTADTQDLVVELAKFFFHPAG